MVEILYGNIRKAFIMTDNQIRKLKEKKIKLDDQIMELRMLRKEAKDNDKIDEVIILNIKIDALRDKKASINNKLRIEHNKRISCTLGIDNDNMREDE